jgi:hypothetical protein
MSQKTLNTKGSTYELAKNIFKYLGIEYSVRRPHEGNMIIHEGVLGPHLLCIHTISKTSEFGIQMRTPDTYKDRGGILFQDISTYTVTLEDTDKRVTIRGKEIEVYLNEWGLHSSIKTAEVSADITV